MRWRSGASIREGSPGTRQVLLPTPLLLLLLLPMPALLLLTPVMSLPASVPPPRRQN